MSSSIPVILDTDIGDDIDDAYALALILRSPELDLRAVTTVYGNTLARARQAQTVLKVAGREDVPVAAGTGAVMAVRPEPQLKTFNDMPFDGPAHNLVADVRPIQDSSCLPARDLPPLDARHGIDLLVEEYLKSDGGIQLVTIGALTNVAMALIKEPRIKFKIPRIVAMAGVFNDRLMAEWNILCDPLAAAIVCQSGIPVTFVGLDVTLKCRFNDADLARLHGSDKPLAKNLSAATKAWSGRYPILHDPLAVETIFRPDIVERKTGRVAVEIVGHSTFGFTVFKEEAGGPHEICVAVKGTEAIDLWLSRVLS